MKTTHFERALFLSWYCSKADCKFCYMSTQKQKIKLKNPKFARRKLESIYAEALICKHLSWEIEFLSGGYESFSIEELVEIAKNVKKIYGKKQWLNIGMLKKEELENQFNFNKFKKTYVLFPNVPWDAALLSSDIVFQSVYEWINHTIKIFLNKPDLLLIIKIHPSEIRVMQSKYTVLDYIKEKCDSLPENIKIIPPDTKISPYSLFPYIDVGLVYNGTIGLEMATRGIPVVTAGDAHYGKKGFTYDVKTIDEYSKILFEDISKLPNQEKKANIYSYFHFIKKFQPRPFIYGRNFIDLGWKVKSLDDFEPGKNKIIDHLCNYIVKGGVFQNW